MEIQKKKQVNIITLSTKLSRLTMRWEWRIFNLTRLESCYM